MIPDWRVCPECEQEFPAWTTNNGKENPRVECSHRCYMRRLRRLYPILRTNTGQRTGRPVGYHGAGRQYVEATA